MEQVLFCGGFDPLHPTNTEYGGLVGSATWVTTEASSQALISTSGKIKNLRVKLDGSPGAGKSYVFTLRVNGVSKALTTTISDAETSDADAVNEVSVSAGDRVTLECAPSGTPTVRNARWTMVFKGDTAKESLLLGGTAGTLDSTTIEYALVGGTGYAFSSTENDFRRVCPTAGAIKNLYVWLSADPGISPDAYRFTLRVNGVSTALTATITADDTTGNDTTNSVDVVAGDVLTLMIEPLNSPSATPSVAFGMTFLADTDGESLVLGSGNGLPLSATEYAYITGAKGQTWGATETQKYMLGQSSTLKKLYILLENDPSPADSYTFTIRKNGASPSSGLVVTISGTATTGNDTTNTVTVSDDDDIDIQVVPTSSPDTGTVYWGLVCHIEVVELGFIWVEGTKLHYIATDAERSYEGTDTTANGEAGHLWVEGTYLHYIDENGDERREEGTLDGATGQEAGHIWIESTKLRYIDSSGDERYIEGS